MLQEVLLSLSGFSSPLLQQACKTDYSPDHDKLIAAFSPPERALLAQLGHISELHIRLKQHADKIASKHSSIICRAVASSITSTPLKQFRGKALEVERLILSQDAEYVGGYAIVPLSRVVSEFAPWRRRLEWLWDVACFMLPTTSKDATNCTGAAIIDHLRHQSYTGYEDLQAMANGLIEIAEMVWLRQLCSWVLYGKLPSFGAEDFFVRQSSKDQGPYMSDTFVAVVELTPGFITAQALQSVLFVGKSIRQINSQVGRRSQTAVNSDPATNLLPSHLEHLTALKSPVSSAAFSASISAIRLSISQNALAQLLPSAQVETLLKVLHDFMLLGRGEFVVSLVSAADESLSVRHRQRPSQPVRKAGRLDSINVKDGEIAAVLKQTWEELDLSLIDEDEGEEVIDMAKELLRLAVQEQTPIMAKVPARVLLSTLLPTPTSLLLHITADSSLNLFLSLEDQQTYTVINDYLVSLRRADMHLAALWKLTSLRRTHPCPRGSPKQLAQRRRRNDTRTLSMHKYWATASKALFVVSELGGYLQGEVIQHHWEQFQDWMGTKEKRPSSAIGSRPGTSSSAGLQISQSSYNESLAAQQTSRSDPSTLAQAHQAMLAALVTDLLLANESFVTALRDLLPMIDHLVALFLRLVPIQQGIDLQEDEGVVDALANYAKDEKDVLAEMDRSRKTVEEQLIRVVDTLRAVEEYVDPGLVSTSRRLENTSIGDDRTAFVPWHGRTLDRLIMKLEFLAGTPGRDQTDVDD